MELSVEDYIEKSKVWETPECNLSCYSTGMKYIYFVNKKNETLTVLDALNEMKVVFSVSHPHLKNAW